MTPDTAALAYVSRMTRPCRVFIVDTDTGEIVYFAPVYGSLKREMKVTRFEYRRWQVRTDRHFAVMTIKEYEKACGLATQRRRNEPTPATPPYGTEAYELSLYDD